jgi:microcystin-dependent protein
MADERPVDDPVQQLGKLQRDFDDFRSTMMARLSRRATGDVEPTIRQTPKAGTLHMQGQLVLRADYPGLWQWVQDNSLLMTGLFGPGNGTTNFGLPNFGGRVPVGVGTLGSDTYSLGNLVGSAFRTLSQANMAEHGGHWKGTTSNVGYVADAGAPSYISPFPDLDGYVGTNTPFDNRQASIAINWAIWT